MVPDQTFRQIRLEQRLLQTEVNMAQRSKPYSTWNVGLHMIDPSNYKVF